MTCKFFTTKTLLGILVLLTTACQNQDHADQADASLLQERALTLAWNNTWSSSVQIDGGNAPADLSGILSDKGGLALDLQVEDLARGDLKLLMHCGTDCVRQVDISPGARELEGRGWQSVSIPLSCFARPGDRLDNITAPFIAEGAGTGRVSFAHVRYEKTPANTFGCLPPEELPVTPAPLTANWALDWWMPRHQEKLEQAAEGDFDLVLVGDSITHGWEDAGANVWQQYFSGYKTLNLGFSGDRTENVLWRFEHGEVDGISPEVAVVMIGTNNAGHRQEPSALTAKGVDKIIEELKERLPETEILLLGIFPRGETAGDPLRELNRETNRYLEKMGEDKRVTYLNINDAFLTQDGALSKDIMPDLLHPNEQGYEIWAEAMKPVLLEILAE